MIKGLFLELKQENNSFQKRDIMNKISILFLIISLSIVSMQVSAQTKVIAHRGFSSVAPENTLIAFQKAIDAGANYFELDVHKTKDDSVIVIHDNSLKRTSSDGREGKIEELTYQELVGAKVGYSEKFGEEFKNEKLPTLREALELAKGQIKVCIEIKVYGVEESVLKTVEELGMDDEVIIFSFYYPVLAKIRQYDKDIPILYLKSDADEETIYYAEAIKANAIGVGTATTITKEFLEFAHAQDMEVWQWTVNEEAEMQRLIKIGIDGIITNFPNSALDSLRKVK